MIYHELDISWLVKFSRYDYRCMVLSRYQQYIEILPNSNRYDAYSQKTVTVDNTSIYNDDSTITHNGRHHKVLIQESISISVSFKHEVVTIVSDLSTNTP